MIMKKGSLFGKVKAVVFSVVMTAAVLTSSFTFAEPIVAHATMDDLELYKVLSSNEQKVYDLYEKLEDKSKSKKTRVTPENFGKYKKSDFIKVYSNSTKKKKFKASELRNGRRAYVYSHPTNLVVAMSELNFVYLEKVKGNGKTVYTCYAYLKRNCDSNLKKEQKQLNNTIESIMSTINDENDTVQTTFTTVYEIFNALMATTRYDKTEKIDSMKFSNTAYGALVKHKATSLGYSLAFEALLDAANIDSNVLFDENYCWVQTCIAADGQSDDPACFFEIDLAHCDNAKNGALRLGRFGISYSEMKNYHLRKGYCKKLPKSKGNSERTRNYLNGIF